MLCIEASRLYYNDQSGTLPAGCAGRVTRHAPPNITITYAIAECDPLSGAPAQSNATVTAACTKQIESPAIAAPLALA